MGIKPPPLPHLILSSNRPLPTAPIQKTTNKGEKNTNPQISLCHLHVYKKQQTIVKKTQKNLFVFMDQPVNLSKALWMDLYGCSTICSMPVYTTAQCEKGHEEGFACPFCRTTSNAWGVQMEMFCIVLSILYGGSFADALNRLTCPIKKRRRPWDSSYTPRPMHRVLPHPAARYIKERRRAWD